MDIIEDKDKYLCLVSGGVKDSKSVKDIGQDIMSDLDGIFKTDQEGIA